MTRVYRLSAVLDHPTFPGAQGGHTTRFQGWGPSIPGHYFWDFPAHHGRNSDSDHWQGLLIQDGKPGKSWAKPHPNPRVDFKDFLGTLISWLYRSFTVHFCYKFPKGRQALGEGPWRKKEEQTGHTWIIYLFSIKKWYICNFRFSSELEFWGYRKPIFNTPCSHNGLDCLNCF